MSYNPFSLKGKTVLVTGASSGIGECTAIECSKLGAKVILTARNEERLKRTLSQLEGEGHIYLSCDLNDETAIDNLVDFIPEVHGVVNNAGYAKLMPIQFITHEDLSSMLNVNTIAPMLILKKLLKKKKIKKGTSVVFTSSIAGLGQSSVGNAMYTASKGAISAFIRCAALELAPKQIRVNAVCPAMVKTAIMDSGSVTQAQLEEDMKNYPLGRYGNPKDVALAMVYLLSDASEWMTGNNLIIDGGVTLK